MTNKSSYRKQKDRIKELEHDIKMMVLYPELEESIDIYMKHRLRYDKDKSDKLVLS